MNNNTASILFFALSTLAGLVMVVEASLILRAKSHAPEMPLPSRVLYGLGALVAGPAESRRRFSGRNTPQALRAYARVTLLFGLLVLGSSFVYLFTNIL